MEGWADRPDGAIKIDGVGFLPIGMSKPLATTMTLPGPLQSREP